MVVIILEIHKEEQDHSRRLIDFPTLDFKSPHGKMHQYSRQAEQIFSAVRISVPMSTYSQTSSGVLLIASAQW
jgi:hypothetical protein